MSWNVVLDKVCEIKEKAFHMGIDLWAYDPEVETCLEYWVRMIGDDEYKNLTAYLQFTEWNRFLLVRYGDYSRVFAAGTEVTFDSFWDLYDGFYKECRSVVIDVEKEALVLTPFKKFRNLNEGEENLLENVKKRIEQASCVEISDKMDGSMQTARYYEGEIRMAGSQALNKEVSWRLADGWRMLMEQENYQEMIKDHPNKTFIFEYISKMDAHVVNYDVEGLFLIGVRDVETGEESSYKEVLEYARRYGVLATKVFDKTIDQVLMELDEVKSCDAEGFVVNIDGFKVKIKYNDYVDMHKILSKLSSISLIIEKAAEGKIDDVRGKVPAAYRDRVERIAKIVLAYKNKTETEVEKFYAMAPKEDRKEFMIWVHENVPKEIQGFVRNRYLLKPYNVLKRAGGYLKLKDMGVEDYMEVFENEE